MNNEKTLAELRAEIDGIDAQLLACLEKRMELSRQVGLLKRENKLPVYSASREAKLIADRMARSGNELKPYISSIYRGILSASRRLQWQAEGVRILIINGPNLNLLGSREPELYGTEDYDALCTAVMNALDECKAFGEIYQSNHEGEIVELIQAASGCFDGIVINPAAFTHTSIAIPDALKAVHIPAIEVHLTDISSRENYRAVSYTAEACIKQIKGLGIEGYVRAVKLLCKMTSEL